MFFTKSDISENLIFIYKFRSSFNERLYNRNNFINSILRNNQNPFSTILKIHL